MVLLAPALTDDYVPAPVQASYGNFKIYESLQENGSVLIYNGGKKVTITKRSEVEIQALYNRSHVVNKIMMALFVAFVLTFVGAQIAVLAHAITTLTAGALYLTSLGSFAISKIYNDNVRDEVFQHEFLVFKGKWQQITSDILNDYFTGQLCLNLDEPVKQNRKKFVAQLLESQPERMAICAAKIYFGFDKAKDPQLHQLKFELKQAEALLKALG